MSTMTMERPSTITNEWNHSCGPACGNCGNPNNAYTEQVGTEWDADLLPRPEAER